MFAVTALAAAVLALYIRRLPEPPRAEPERRPVRALLRAVANRWVLLVLLLGFVEGVAITGSFTFVAPSVEHATRAGAGLAGTVVAAYGVAVLGFSRVVRPLSARLSTPTLLLIGGTPARWGSPSSPSSAATPPASSPASCSARPGPSCTRPCRPGRRRWRRRRGPRSCRCSRRACSSADRPARPSAACSPGNGHYGPLFTISAGLFLPLTVVSAVTRRRYLRTRRGR